MQYFAPINKSLIPKQSDSNATSLFLTGNIFHAYYTAGSAIPIVLLAVLLLMMYGFAKKKRIFLQPG